MMSRLIILSLLLTIITADEQLLKVLYRGAGHTKEMTDIAVAGNFVLTAGADSKILAWNIMDGKLFRTLDGHTSSVLSLAVMNDGSFYSSGQDNTLKRWNQTTWTLTWSVTTPNFPQKIARYNDSTIIVACADGILISYDVFRQRELLRYTGGVNKYASILIKGTQLIAGDEEKRIRIWDANNGALLFAFDSAQHSYKVMDMVFWGNSIISIDNADLIVIWGPNGQFYDGGNRHATPFTNALRGAVIGNTLYLAGIKGLKTIDLSLRPVSPLAITAVPHRVVISNGNNFLTFSDDGAFRLLRADNTMIWETMQSAVFVDLAVNDDSIFGATYSRSVWEYSLTTGEFLGEFTSSPFSQVTCVKVALDLFGGHTDGRIVQWNLATRAISRTYFATGNVVDLDISLAFMSVYAVVGGVSQRVQRFSINNGNMFSLPPSISSATPTYLYISGNRVIVSDSNGIIEARGTAAGNILWYVIVGTDLSDIQTDDQFIYIAFQSSIQVLSLADGNLVKQFDAPATICQCHVRCGSLFGAFCNGSAIVQWNITSMSVIRRYNGTNSSIASLISQNMSLFGSFKDASLVEWRVPELNQGCPSAAALLTGTSSARTRMTRTSTISSAVLDNNGPNTGDEAATQNVTVQLIVIYGIGLVLALSCTSAVFYMRQFPPWTATRRSRAARKRAKNLA